MTDSVEIARAADVDSAVNQPGDEPIMYTGETFRDCATDLLLPETSEEMERLRWDVMYGVYWLDSLGNKPSKNEVSVIRARHLYESAFRVGMALIMNVSEQGITAEQLGLNNE